MTNSIGSKVTDTLTALLGRDVPTAVSDWLGTQASFDTITDDTDAESLSDAELYEIAEKLLAQADTETDLEKIKQYEDIANAIFSSISSDDDADIEDNDDDVKTTTDYTQDVQDFVDLDQSLETDLEDGTIDDTTVTDYLGDSTATELPTGFEALSPQEQSAIIEYYNEQGNTTLAATAIKAVSTNDLDDVMADLYASDPETAKTALTDRFTDSTEADVANDIRSLLSEDGSFADMPALDKVGLVGDLITIVQGDALTTDSATDTTTPPLENVLIQALQANSDFVDAVNASGDDANNPLKGLKDLLNQTVDDTTSIAASFSALDPTAFTTSLETTLTDAESESTGTTEAKTLKTDIVAGRDSDPKLDIATTVTTSLNTFLSGDTPPVLDEDGLKDFFDEILSNNANLTDDEYKTVITAVKTFYGTLESGNKTAFKETFDDAIDDASDGDFDTTRLKLPTNDTSILDADIAVDSGVFSVSDTELYTLKTALKTTPPDLTNSQSDKLLLALQDPSITDKEPLIAALVDLILSDTKYGDILALEYFHSHLQRFPELLDTLETMQENNPDNKVLNFLTSPYDSDADYATLATNLESKSSDFKTILSDALVGTTDTDYKSSVDLSSDESTLLDSLSKASTTADADDNDETTTETVKNDAFDAYITAGGNYTALTDVNSNLYQASDDKETLLQDTLNWLMSKSATEQAAFLNSISSTSELYFALTQLANDLLEADSESELGQALKDITTAIKDGTTIASGDVNTLFDKDADDNIALNASSIFTNIELYQTDGAIPQSMRDFINILGADGLTQAEVDTFVSGLSSFEASQFFKSLLSDNSPLTLLNKDLSATFDMLLTTMSDKATDAQRQQFLESIPSDGTLFSMLEAQGLNQDILDAITNQDFSDIDTADITEFFADDIFKETVKNWNNSSIIEGYLADIDGLSDKDEIADVLDTAKEAGNIQILLSELVSDDSESLNEDSIIGIFDWLDNNKTEANSFFDSLPANSNFNTALKTLISDEIEPFDKLSIDDTTGKLKTSDQNKLIKILKDSDNADAINSLLDEIDIEQENKDTLNDSVGGDNQDVRNLTSDIIAAGEAGSIDFAKYLSPEVDDSTSPVTQDYSKAEDLLDDIMSDDNYLVQSLDATQLENFAKQFITYLKSAPAELLEYFGDNIDTDSVFGKALIAAGANIDDIDNATDATDYKKILSDAKDYEAFANLIKIAKERSDGTSVTDYMLDTLRGLEDKNDIDTAAQKILDFAFVDETDTEILIDDILSGTGQFSQLSQEQAEALMEALFDRINKEKLAEDETFSKTQQLFLDNLQDSAFYTDYIVDNNTYSDIQAYFNGDDVDDSKVSKELKKLFSDNSIIKDFINSNSESNETEVDDSVLDVSDSSTDTYNDETVKDGYSALIRLFDRDAIAGEKGQLSDDFFEKSGQSAEAIGKKAADGDFSLDEVAGIIAIMPPQEAADFIEAFFVNGGGQDNDTVSFLLGQLMTYQIDGDIDDSQFEDIINNIDNSDNESVKTFFEGYSVTDLIDNSELRAGTASAWAQTAQNKLTLTSQERDSTITDIGAYVDDTTGVGSVSAEQAEQAERAERAEQQSQQPYPYGQGGGYGPFPGAGTTGFPPLPTYPSAEDLYNRGFVAAITQFGFGGLGGFNTSPNTNQAPIPITINYT